MRKIDKVEYDITLKKYLNQEKIIETLLFTYLKIMPNSKKTIDTCYSRRKKSHERWNTQQSVCACTFHPHMGPVTS